MQVLILPFGFIGVWEIQRMKLIIIFLPGQVRLLKRERQRLKGMNGDSWAYILTVKSLSRIQQRLAGSSSTYYFFMCWTLLPSPLEV